MSIIVLLIYGIDRLCTSLFKDKTEKEAVSWI